MAEQQLRRIDELTWGERLHLAYRRCRQDHGLTYDQHAKRISEWVPVSDQTLMRMELSEELPRLPRQRQLLYFVLLSYGHEPESFGLTVENSALGNFDVAKARRLLAPGAKRKGGVSKEGCTSPSSGNTDKESCHVIPNTPRYSAIKRGMAPARKRERAGQSPKAAA